MTSDQPHARNNHLVDLARDAERVFAVEPNDLDPARVAEIRASLARIEEASPGGAPLHAQLDNVRKWLDALERPADHERFGGIGHLRDYVLTQLRLALGALEDYRREMK